MPDHDVALVTNVADYAGPPAAAALQADGYRVFCHRSDFGDGQARAAFEAASRGLEAISALEPEALIADVVARAGRLDVLISNDFCPVPSETIEGASADELRATLETLLVTPFSLLRSAVPVMKRQGGGRIVLVTSGASLRAPASGRPSYNAARAAANELTRCLATELAPFGIQVNAVAPYLLSSQTFFPSDIGSDDPKFVERVNALVPMRRFGRPEEIGALIAFLASGKSSFVSGQIIAFSGAGV